MSAVPAYEDLARKVEVYKDASDRWRWRIKSKKNGRLLANGNESYNAKADCITNLEKTTLGSVEITYQARAKGTRRMYQQGYLYQWDGDRDGEAWSAAVVATFLEVIPDPEEES